MVHIQVFDLNRAVRGPKQSAVTLSKTLFPNMTEKLLTECLLSFNPWVLCKHVSLI